MDKAIQVACEVCGQQSEVMKNRHVDASGKQLEWPKATVKPDGIYFAISCPKCGEREQCMARPNDA